MNDKTIKHDNDIWRIVSVGAERDGLVYLHLASTTKFRQQRNGQRPIQMCDWLPVELLAQSV
jgi:hypothetical protein